MDGFLIYLIGSIPRIMSASLMTSIIFLFIGIFGSIQNWARKTNKFPFNQEWLYVFLIASSAILFMIFVFAPDRETLCSFLESGQHPACLYPRWSW